MWWDNFWNWNAWRLILVFQRLQFQTMHGAIEALPVYWVLAWRCVLPFVAAVGGEIVSDVGVMTQLGSHYIGREVYFGESIPEGDQFYSCKEAIDRAGWTSTFSFTHWLYLNMRHHPLNMFKHTELFDGGMCSWFRVYLLSGGWFAISWKKLLPAVNDR